MRLKKVSDITARCRGAILGVTIIIATILSGAVMTGCSSSGCSDNQSALPLMGFYSSSTRQSMSLDSIDIGGIGAPHDSLLVHSGQEVSQLYLPFRQDQGSTSFRIHYNYKEQGLDDPAYDDIVTFHYTARPYFASEECGAMYIYIIDRVEYTRHLIEEIVIADSVINNVEMERIHLFFRTADNEENPGEGDEA